MAKEKEAPQAETKEEIKNIVSIADSGPCKKKISVEIPPEKISKALDEQYEDLRKNALVPGFRKGRAPRRLLEKRFGKESTEQVKLKLLIDASDKAMKDNNIEAIGEPILDHDKIELPEKGSLKFEFEIETRPEFKLPELQGLPVEKPKLEVSDEQVELEVKELQKRMGTWKPKDGKIALDDQIVADVTLKADGESEKISNSEIYIRPRGFAGKVVIDDLDKLLIGAKAGDTKTTETDVPATFFEEKYRGKKVEVEIKINDVKALVPVELNEEFFKRVGIADINELKTNLRQRNEKNLQRQQQDAMRQEVRNYLLGKITLDLPADVVADQSSHILQRQYTRMLLQGAKAEDIKKQMEQLKASSEEQARESLKAFFIMDAVAKKFGIEATDEEINGYIAQAAMYRQVRPEKLREQMSRDGSLAEAAMEIREIKCIDKILETAKITEVAPEKLAAKHEAAHKHEHAAGGEPGRTTKKHEKKAAPSTSSGQAKAEKKAASGEPGRTEKKVEKPAKKTASGEPGRTEKKPEKSVKKSTPTKKSDKKK
ncbi:MAG: trigger factor [Sedimentisphaerales bacterium]|jgi:trigger factor